MDGLGLGWAHEFSSGREEGDVFGQGVRKAAFSAVTV